MNNHTIRHTLLSLTLLLMTASSLFLSCTPRVEEVFDRSSAVRFAETSNNFRQVLLQAPNGWLVSYYPDLVYGGYNMMWKFNADSTVVCACELIQREDDSQYLAEDTTSLTHFKIEQSQGVVLSFDEYTDMVHIFADPSDPFGVGGEGEGLLGDFEFRLVSACADSVVMLGKKHQSRIVMTPMPADADWGEYMHRINQTDMAMYPETGRYYLYMGEEEIEVRRSNNTLIFPSVEKDGLDISVPMIVRPEGFRLYEPFTYKGHCMTGFNYTSDRHWDCPSDPDVWMKKAAPALSDRVYAENWYFRKGEWCDDIDRIFSTYPKRALQAEDEVLDWMYMGGYDDGTYALYFQSGGVYYGWIGFNIVAKDRNTLFLQYNRTADDNAWGGEYYYKYCNFDKIVTVIGNSKGYDYRLTSDDDENPSWIRFDNLTVPGYWFTLYKEKSLYPFGE